MFNPFYFATSLFKKAKKKILFQPNTIMPGPPLECPAKTSVNKETKECLDNNTFKVILECNQESLAHLEKLERFFEISQPDVIAKGVWLMTLVRDLELEDKKLGIITTNHQGVITNITPIDLV